MNLLKIKTFFSNIWLKLTVFLGLVVAVLLWVLNIRDKELAAAREKINLLQTQKEADLLETDINSKLNEIKMDQVTRKGYQKVLEHLQKKRESLRDRRTTDQAKADYWNNKK